MGVELRCEISPDEVAFGSKWFILSWLPTGGLLLLTDLGVLVD